MEGYVLDGHNGEWDPHNSDHRPIIIDAHGLVERRHSLARSMVPRFEARWLEKDDCEDIIREAWEKEVGKNQ